MNTVFKGYVELTGDGRTATDPCIRGGLAKLNGWQCVVLGTTKGHTPSGMQAANFGMPTPAGYRTALKLFGLAERFNLPVVTLVDTVGAWPSFEAEEAGQSEAVCLLTLLIAWSTALTWSHKTAVSRSYITHSMEYSAH